MASAVARAIAQNRAAILRRDRETLGRLLHAYADADKRLRPLIALVEDDIAALGAEATPGKVMQLERMQLLLDQLEQEVTRLARLSASETLAAQGDVVALAQRQTPTLLAAAGASQTAQIAASFVRLPTTVVERLIGIAGDGAPLGNLFAEMGGNAARVFIDELTAGLSLGRHPTVTADAVTSAVEVSRNRALTIARTETLRAYRGASLETFAANADVLDGWIWISAQDDTTCAACLAMDGTFHGHDETMDSHPNCRCTPVPSVRGIDLGLGPTGAEHFAELSSGKQDEILGIAAGEAYRSGQVALEDFVKVTSSPVWGDTITQDSLLGALARAERGGRAAAA